MLYTSGMTSGIYLIVQISTGLLYIGSSANIRGRWASHRCDLRKRRHGTPRLQNAWSKHGEADFAFAVLEEVSVERLLEREQFWIDVVGSADLRYGFNTQPVAECRRGVSIPPEAAAKIAAFHRGKPKTAEHRAKLAEAKRGQRRTPETLAKISAALTGRRLSAETIAKFRQYRAGRPQRRKRAMTYETATEIRTRHMAGETAMGLARWAGVSRNSIRCVLAGTTYTQP